MQKKETPIETFLDFYNCNFDFLKYLRDYLKKEENKVKYEDNKNIAKIFKKSLLNFMKYLNIDQKRFFDETDETINFSYICFNYTSVFNKCLDILKNSNIFQLEKRNKTGIFRNMFILHNDLGNVFHIHGTIENNMILGVNDLKQILNTEFHNIDKVNTFIKPKVNDLLENNRNPDATKLIEDADVYCIFGMSIGKTDRKWWIEISKQIINNSEKQLIIYAYDENLDGAFPEDTLETIENNRNIFLNHLKFTKFNKDEIKEEIRNNIHVAIDKDMFKINLT